MKKKTARLALIVTAMLVVFGGCRSGLEKVPVSGGVNLFFFLEVDDGERVALDPGKDPVYRRVEVNGTGPAGGGFTLASVEPSCSLNDLTAGSWQLEVRAFSPQEEVVAGFSGPVTIGVDKLRQDILLVPLGKKATLHAEVLWDGEFFSNPEIELGIFAGGTIPLIMEPGNAIGELEVEPGVALLRVLFGGDRGRAAGVFPFFAGPGMEFDALIEVTASEEEAPLITFDFEPLQLTPTSLTIEGTGPPFYVGREEDFFLTGIQETGIQENGDLWWFLEDEEIGAGPPATIASTEEGRKTLTAVLAGSKPPSIALGRLQVRFNLPYRVGPAVLFQQIGGPEGVRGLSGSPCGGYVAAAGYSSDSLVLWHRNPDSGELEVFIETGAQTEDLLDGVSDTTFSPSGDLLAAASKNASSLLLWDLEESGAWVEPGGSMEPIAVLRASEPGMEFLDGVSALAFSEDGRFLYAAASDSDSLAVFEVTVDGLEVLQVLDTADIGSGLFDGPADIALSGAGFSGLSGETGEIGLNGGAGEVDSFDPARAAVPCLGGDSLFIFHRDPQSGILSPLPERIFTDGVDGTELLNGVHRAVFHEHYLYSSSYYDDAVCLFTWVPNTGNPQDTGVWEYHGGWDSFDVAPGGTGGICPEVPVGDLEYLQEIAVSPDGLVLALAAGGNDGVCLFTRDPADGSLTPLAAAVDGTTGLPGLGAYPAAPADPLQGFDGARSVVWSPDGKNLYCGASNSNTVSVFQEW